jgi:hypothetical protein
MSEENTYKLFKVLETAPDNSQHQLAEELGFSLGVFFAELNGSATMREIWISALPS